MSERERWIVYPLLFLALGAALRDKLLKQTEVASVICESLTIVDDQRRPQAVLKGSELNVGTVKANIVVAHQQLRHAGQPVATSGRQTARLPLKQLPQLLQFLQQSGMLRVTPAAPAKDAAPAQNDATPRGGAPGLPAPQTGPGASGADSPPE